MKHLMWAAGVLEAAGMGQIGTDIFVTTLPGDVKYGIMLRDPLAGHEVDPGMAGFFSSEFQLIVRDVDPEAGYNKAKAAADLLTQNRVETADITVAWVRPMTLPISYPRGSADDIETSVRFRVGFGLK